MIHTLTTDRSIGSQVRQDDAPRGRDRSRREPRRAGTRSAIVRAAIWES